MKYLGPDLVRASDSNSAFGLPPGGAFDTVQASEALAAGAWVNVYDAAGADRVRNANGSDPLKFCNGFVLAAVSSGGNAKVFHFGLNSVVTVPATISELYLSDATPGGHTATAPSASGSIVQPLGLSRSGVGVFFFPQQRIVL